MKKAVIILAVLAALSFAAAGAHLLTSSEDFSRFNYGWNGTSELYETLLSRGAMEMDDYDQLEGRTDTGLLIIAPEREYEEGDIDKCRAFLSAGNTIVILDEKGYANGLLAGLGTGMSVLPGTLVGIDRVFPAENGTLIATAEGEDPLLDGVSMIATNRPAPCRGGEVLIATSPVTWVVQEGETDGAKDLASYPVCVAESAGGGRVYLISDASLSINEMADIPSGYDNARFLENIAEIRSNIIMDVKYSAAADSSGLPALFNAGRNTTVIKISALIIIILAILAIMQKTRGKKEHDD